MVGEDSAKERPGNCSVYDDAMHGASRAALRDGTENQRSVADRLRCLLLGCYAGIEVGECLDE